MTEFNKSQWAQAQFAQHYIENADNFILERQRLLCILKSFYKHFVSNKPDIRILDLGCGDGILTHEILKVNDRISSTLIDGSEDMLNKAKERLKGFNNICFIKASFQEMLAKDIADGNYDLIISSMAIHHLTMQEKRSLFKTIYAHLNNGGYFLNIDVTLAPTQTLEDWYLLLWSEWIKERNTSEGGDEYIVQKYKDNTDNKPDTLDNQLKALRSIGFLDVDCFYKYGIFTIFGGRK